MNIVQSLLYIDCQSADSLVDVGLRSLAIVMAAEDEVLDSKIKFWDLGGAQLVECELFGTLPVFGVEPGFEGGPFDFVAGAPGISKGELEVDVLIGRDGTDENSRDLACSSSCVARACDVSSS